VIGHGPTAEPVPAPAEPEVDRRLLLAGGLLAVLPLLTAAARALRDGWYPVGDNAFFALRARDVLTEHHPLLGTWTSASLSGDVEINNPGALLYYLLAIPARVDPESGLVVGVVALHLAMVGLAGWFAWRRGPGSLVAVLAAYAALFWTMGGDLLVEPWQPHSLLPAFLALLVLVWSLALGDGTALPFAVGVGSLLVQTHLSYATLVLGLGAGGIAALVVVRRADRDALVRPALVAVLVALVLWAPPLVEQVSSGSDGNLGNVARSALGEGDDDAARVGASTAGRIVAATVALPPWWARDSFAETLDAGVPGVVPPDELPNLPSGAAGSLALLGLVAALGAAATLAHRRGDRAGLVAAAVAGGAVGLAVLTVAIIPLGPLGFAAHQVRWLWPMATFTTGALVLGLLPRPWSLRVAAAGLVVLALAGLPAHHQELGPSLGPSGDAEVVPSLGALAAEVDALSGYGTLLVDVEGLRLFEPYSTPLMLELQRRGIPFVSDHVPTIRQLGESRRDQGQADAVVYVADGPAADRPRPGAERVVYLPATDGRPPVGVFVTPLER
jgi:hypothetical protein